MICPNCQSNLPDGAKFCTSCGNAVSAQPQPSQPQPAQPFMQYRQETEAPQPVQQQQPVQEQQPTQQQAPPQMQARPQQIPPRPQILAVPPAEGSPGSGKSNKGLIAGLIAIGVALVAVITVLVLFLTGVIGGGMQPSVDPGPQVVSGVTGTEPDVNLTDEPPGTGMPDPDADAPQPLTVTAERQQAVYTDTLYTREMELLRISCETLTIENGSEAIRKYAEDFSKTQEEQFRSRALSEAQEVYSTLTEYPRMWEGTWVDESSLLLDRADTQVLSFVLTENVSSGGPHGSTWYRPFNIDAETGAEIAFSKIVKDHRALADAMFAEMKKHKEFDAVVYYYENDSETTFAEYIQEFTLMGAEGGLLCWSLSPDGFHVWFSDYELGAYAMGRGDLIIPFGDYPEVFHENVYTTQSNVPAVTDAQLTRRETEPVRRNMTEYCVEEFGVMPTAYCAWNGIYSSGEDRLEITSYGRYEIYENGTLVSEGELRDTPPATLLFEGYFDMDISKNVYGQILDLPEKGEGVVGISTGDDEMQIFTYDAEASEEIGYSRRKAGPVAITEEQMESLWTDGYNVEHGIQLYAWRGEFETEDPDGRPVTGDIIYNGDEFRPVYTLRTADGTDYAEICFLDGAGMDMEGDPVMWITWLQEEERTGILFRAKG